MKYAMTALVIMGFFIGTNVFADQYLVVKDKANKCKLEVFRADKGTIVAGPFNSKEEGVAALQDKCPDAVKKPAEKKMDKK